MASPPSKRAASKTTYISLLEESQDDDDDVPPSTYARRASTSASASASAHASATTTTTTTRQGATISLLDDSQQADDDDFDEVQIVAESSSSRPTPLPAPRRRADFSSPREAASAVACAPARGPVYSSSSASSSSSSAGARPAARSAARPQAVVECFTTSAVPASSQVASYLVVDQRERRANDQYQSLASSIENQLSRRVRVRGSNDMQSIVASIRIGDYVMMLEEESTGRQWMAGTLVERKTLNDIMSGSAFSTHKKGSVVEEARHFRQERQLRYCGARHPFMLIEGTWGACSLERNQPRVGNNAVRDLARPDVISCRDELMKYCCAVVARNVGPRRVKILCTVNDAATATLLAALSLVTQQIVSEARASGSPLKLPELGSFLDYWKYNKIDSRRVALERLLRAAGLGDEAEKRVVRRFGDEQALRATYVERCSTDHHALGLLTDLSLGQSNCGMAVAGDGEEGEEEDFEEDNLTAEDSAKMFRHFHPESECVLPISTGPRTLVVLHNPSMGKVLRGKSEDSLSALFPENYDFVLVGTADNDENTTPAQTKAMARASSSRSRAPLRTDLAWAHVHVEEAVFAQSSPTAPADEVTLQSTPLAMVVVPGLVVIQAIADAFVAFSGNPPTDPQQLDLQVISLALEFIEAKFPPDIKELTGLSTDDCRPERVLESTQLAMIVQFLGDGGKKAGAVGKIDSLHDKRALARQNGQPLPLFMLDKNSDDVITEAAAAYIQKDSRWLLSLFTATASLKFQWQVIHTGSDAEDVERWVVHLMHESHRLALLTTDGHDDEH